MAVSYTHLDVYKRQILNMWLTEDIAANKDVRQGFSISSALFNVYIDDIFWLWNAEEEQEYYFKEAYVWILYADDSVKIEKTED